VAAEADRSIMPSSSNQRGPWKLAGAGIELAGAVLVLAFIGYAIDQRLGCYPWLTVVGTLLGFAGGLYNLIKIASLAQQQDENQAGRSSPGQKPDDS
jgi:F0F1-type ATP synthase assembly protein I